MKLADTKEDNKMKKKMLVLALAGIMAVSTLTGCKSVKTVDSEEVLMTVNGEEVAAGLANFYARYTQAQYETYYAAYMGENMWATEVEEGVTYEQSVKDTVLEMVQIMVLSEQHMGDYKVELTDKEKAYVDKAVQEFVDGNKDAEVDMVSGDEATVERYMTLQAISTKVQKAIADTVDKNVSDKEAAQKKMEYVFFSYADTTDEEGNTVALTDEDKAELKAQAQAVSDAVEAGEDFAKAAEAQGVSVNEFTFDSETTTLDAEMIEAADALDEGEYSGVVDTESGVYVAKLVSLLDREATDAKKDEIVAQRQSDEYVAVCEKWIADSEIEVNEDVWAKVDFSEITVTMKVEEAETEEDHEGHDHE